MHACTLSVYVCVCVCVCVCVSVCVWVCVCVYLHARVFSLCCRRSQGQRDVKNQFSIISVHQKINVYVKHTHTHTHTHTHLDTVPATHFKTFSLCLPWLHYCNSSREVTCRFPSGHVKCVCKHTQAEISWLCAVVHSEVCVRLQTSTCTLSNCQLLTYDTLTRFYWSQHLIGRWSGCRL